MENAIANHEFEKARFYSDEERKERENMRQLREKYNLDESSAGVVTKDDIEDVVARTEPQHLSQASRRRQPAGVEGLAQQQAHPVLGGVAVDQAARHDGARERPAFDGDAASDRADDGIGAPRPPPVSSSSILGALHAFGRGSVWAAALTRAGLVQMQVTSRTWLRSRRRAPGGRSSTGQCLKLFQFLTGSRKGGMMVTSWLLILTVKTTP